MKPIRALTRAELLRAVEKADTAFWSVLDEMIAAGRGHETYTQTSAKSDALSLRYTAASNHQRELGAERERRMEYHGSMSPIKSEA